MAKHFKHYALRAPGQPRDRRFVVYSDSSMSITRDEHELGFSINAVLFTFDEAGLRRAESFRHAWMKEHPGIELEVTEVQRELRPSS